MQAKTTGARQASTRNHNTKTIHITEIRAEIVSQGTAKARQSLAGVVRVWRKEEDTYLWPRPPCFKIVKLSDTRDYDVEINAGPVCVQ